MATRSRIEKRWLCALISAIRDKAGITLNGMPRKGDRADEPNGVLSAELSVTTFWTFLRDLSPLSDSFKHFLTRMILTIQYQPN